MTRVIRPATDADLTALYEMAKSTGGGFTNLPPDRDALGRKLVRSHAAFERADPTLGDDLFVFVMEDTETGDIRGTCQLFSQVGTSLPFYSYRRGVLSQHSAELGRTFRAEILSLTTDLEGCSEVGGLFLHPGERSGGFGMLIARSRYLFIRNHRARFAARTLAELRGVINEAGGSPFWDGIGGRFFGMSFQEADEFNGRFGNQFIADLMPKHPVYVAMLDEAARQVVGLPHPNGRAAMKMLEGEGFVADNYVDIFDGGPTMLARTDQIATVRDARDHMVRRIDPSLGEHGDGTKVLAAVGELGAFRAAYAWIDGTDGDIVIDPQGAAALALEPGMSITTIPRWTA